MSIFNAYRAGEGMARRQSVTVPLMRLSTSGLFQDTSGASPVTAAGQSVARARNDGSIAANWLQTIGANCPVFQTSGGDHLAFAGDGDNLQMALSGEFATLSHLWLVTFRLTDLLADQVLFNMGPNSGNGRFTISAKTNGRLRVEMRTTANTSTGSLFDAIPDPLITAGTDTTVAVQLKAGVLDVAVNGLPVLENTAFATASAPVFAHAEAGGLKANTTSTITSPLNGRIMGLEVFRI